MKEEKYDQLEKELRTYEPVLTEASEKIIDEEISSYPIFIFHQQQIDMGLPLWEEDSRKGKWLVHASTLEEFVTKQLIKMEKVDEFLKVYKDPGEHFCIFVISELGANFVFIPRKSRK
jgi:hypothetical protein